VLFLCAGVGLFGLGAWIEIKAVAAQFLLDRAWRETRAGAGAVKPWPWADTAPVARLSVPRLGIDHVVLRGVSGEALAFAPGHMTGSPLPGDRGTSIIAGHRDSHFSFLQELVPGDQVFTVSVSGVRHHFRVTGSRVVQAHASGIDPNGSHPRLALVTCWPFDALTPGGNQRYLVTGEWVSSH
jgi:sortase A